ncbi:MAG: hypothetical protein ACR2PA_02665 [Hyphomicrobiaceae bacterium]
MASATKRGAVAALSISLSIALTGCAGYDVDLQGGVFDALGVSSLGKKKVEPKMANRTGIVVPPTTASLPVPGSAPAGAAPPVGVAGAQWPVDPEVERATKTAALKQQHEAFCEKARRDYQLKVISELPEGPLGSCEQSILRAITGKPLYERKAGQPAN